ncbi:hypothetical protein G9A89_000386 [Geosiphon pyriformis]|nr:hypothetical protein G9A89_000386 [Geosiphon pyriformis]
MGTTLLSPYGTRYPPPLSLTHISLGYYYYTSQTNLELGLLLFSQPKLPPPPALLFCPHNTWGHQQHYKPIKPPPTISSIHKQAAMDIIFDYPFVPSPLLQTTSLGLFVLPIGTLPMLDMTSDSYMLSSVLGTLTYFRPQPMVVCKTGPPYKYPSTHCLLGPCRPTHTITHHNKAPLYPNTKTPPLSHPNQALAITTPPTTGAITIDPPASTTGLWFCFWTLPLIQNPLVWRPHPIEPNHHPKPLKTPLQNPWWTKNTNGWTLGTTNVLGTWLDQLDWGPNGDPGDNQPTFTNLKTTDGDPNRWWTGDWGPWGPVLPVFGTSVPVSQWTGGTTQTPQWLVPQNPTPPPKWWTPYDWWVWRVKGNLVMYLFVTPFLATIFTNTFRGIQIASLGYYSPILRSLLVNLAVYYGTNPDNHHLTLNRSLAPTPPCPLGIGSTTPLLGGIWGPTPNYPPPSTMGMDLVIVSKASLIHTYFVVLVCNTGKFKVIDTHLVYGWYTTLLPSLSVRYQQHYEPYIYTQIVPFGCMRPMGFD